MITPDFIGIGCRRCATSWMHQLLNSHEQIIKTKNGQHYFSTNKTTKEEYYNYYKRNNSLGKTKIDLSVSYSYPEYSARCAEKIKEEIGNIKIFVILRNPYKRAYSDYLRSIRNNEISHSIKFPIAIQNNAELRNRSKYKSIIEPYYKIFGRESLRIFYFEDLEENKFKFVESLQYYLTLTQSFNINNTKYREFRGKNIKYPQINEIYKNLKNRTKDNIEKLLGENNKEIIMNIMNPLIGATNQILLKEADENEIKGISGLYEKDIEYVESITEKNLKNWRI